MNKTIEELREKYTKEKGKKHIVHDDSTGRDYEIPESTWLAKLDEEMRENLSDEEKLSLVLHSKLCCSNHINQCSFYEEVEDKIFHNFSGNGHKTWVEKARKALHVTNLDADTIIELIRVL